MFQSTRPRGRTRHAARLPCGVVASVSIHASSREDATRFLFISFSFMMFQSTRPRGRTRRYYRIRTHPQNSFNPRVLAGGRDVAAVAEDKSAWFQSTRPRGRTRPPLKNKYSSNLKFQSTRPRGRTRQEPSMTQQQFKDVSIHASSREDATVSHNARQKTLCFNPRVLAGGRDIVPRLVLFLIGFQSTRPRGRTRLRAGITYAMEQGFNPRVLAGGRDATTRLMGG